MSLQGNYVHSDELYPVEVFMAVESAHAFLFKEKQNQVKEKSLSKLLHVLEDMRRYSALMSPHYDSQYLHFRRGVWEVIDGVIIGELGILVFETQVERIEWFLKILRMTLINVQVNYLLADFRRGIGALGLDAHETDRNAGFILTQNKYLTGHDAHEVAKAIVEDLHVVVKSYVEFHVGSSHAGV